MDTTQIIEIVKATSGTLDSLVSQTAYFFAIGAASKWLSFSLPLLVLFGIFLRVASTLKASGSKPETVGLLVIASWVLFSLTLFTGVKGVSHIVQAAVAPSIYVATEFGEVAEVLKGLKK